MKKLMSKRLQDILEYRGISQRKLGRLAGLTEASICRYCSGDRYPKTENLQKIADALGVSISYFTDPTCIEITKKKEKCDKYLVVYQFSKPGEIGINNHIAFVENGVITEDFIRKLIHELKMLYGCVDVVILNLIPLEG